MRISIEYSKIENENNEVPATILDQTGTRNENVKTELKIIQIHGIPEHQNHTPHKKLGAQKVWYISTTTYLH